MTPDMYKLLEIVLVSGVALLSVVAVLTSLLFRQLTGAMRQKSAELERLATMALASQVGSTNPSSGAALLQQARRFDTERQQPNKLSGITVPPPAEKLPESLEKKLGGVRIKQGTMG
jgi:hypothetical protein